MVDRIAMAESVERTADTRCAWAIWPFARVKRRYSGWLREPPAAITPVAREASQRAGIPISADRASVRTAAGILRGLTRRFTRMRIWVILAKRVVAIAETADSDRRV
jgi:hypothetical protein